MGRMNEAAMQQEEQENRSGSDDYEAWMHEQKLKETAQQVIAAPACTTDLCLNQGELK